MDKKAIENVGVLPSNVAFIPFWECYDRFPKVQLPFLKPYDNTKIGENISKIISLGRFMEKKAKGTFSELVLKTTNKSGCFSTKAFIVRGTTLERHACSYTV